MYLRKMSQVTAVAQSMQRDRATSRCWFAAWAAAFIGLAYSSAAHAQCASILRDGDFEEQRQRIVRGPWRPEGNAGIDLRLGFSFRGPNNAWARNIAGWNGLSQTVTLEAGHVYSLSGFVRSSPNVRAGYFGFRDATQRPTSEIKFGPLTRYRELNVTFKPARTGPYNIFVGFWAPGQDSWIQVDDVRLYGPCNDQALVPADG